MRTSTCSERSSADRGDLTALQHAQQLGLELYRHVPDLVQEERTFRMPPGNGRAALSMAPVKAPRS